MFEFQILKKSSKSRARLGVIKTSHGEIETPAFIPVATLGAVKALTSEEALKTKSQALIVNTFHFFLRKSEKIVQAAGGLHKFMNWPRPLMTDSGGFQVFSLGFGKDLRVSKISKTGLESAVKIGSQPKLLEIADEGVYFTSYLDGKKIFLGPKESIKIQEKLGADIIFAFDECTPPSADREYTQKSLVKTHNWAKICLEVKSDKKQALFGIIQGGKFLDLRKKSAKFIGSLPFDGFSIGGEFGDDKRLMSKAITAVKREIPATKPIHLLGIGYPEDILPVIKAGVDTFDCVTPTRYARHGSAFTAQGKIDLMKSPFLKDRNPLDKKCDCPVCQNYSRSYISHLLKAKEITAIELLTMHNLYFFNSLVEKIRNGIKNNRI